MESMVLNIESLGRNKVRGFRSMPLPGGRACAARQAASSRQCLHNGGGRADCAEAQALGAFSDPEGGGWVGAGHWPVWWVGKQIQGQ